MDDARLGRMNEPHVRPLMTLIEGWRMEGFDVPSVDPNDAGVGARALFLLESPGPRAVGTGFISRDNPDPSARNMGKSLDLAGFARSDVLLWNVVPYCVSTIERNKNASSKQIRSAIPYTQAFIDRLPNLSVVVFCGRRAQLAASHLAFTAEHFATFHPGAMAYNRARCREHINETFARASARIQTSVDADEGGSPFRQHRPLGSDFD
jgi:hypothetical protein